VASTPTAACELHTIITSDGRRAGPLVRVAEADKVLVVPVRDGTFFFLEKEEYGVEGTRRVLCLLKGTAWFLGDEQCCNLVLKQDRSTELLA
jgi:hypothetical protein